MLVGKILGLHRLGHPRKVGGGEGKNGTHDEIITCRRVKKTRSTLLVEDDGSS